MNWLIFNLLIAHVLGDFYFQTDSFCKNKVLNSYRGKELWIHAICLAVLSGIAVCPDNACAWALILIISVTHFIIDLAKPLLQNIIYSIINFLINGDNKDGENNRYDLIVFLLDQLLHVLIIYGCACCYLSNNGWEEYQCVIGWFTEHPLRVKVFIAMFLAIKPVNILVLLILKFFTVNTSDTYKERNNKNVTVQINGVNVDDKNVTMQINGVTIEETDSSGKKKDEHGNFHSGKLIGYLERCLILIFVVLSQYEAIGFLIAAKSILRFGEASSGTEKSEYVLAGTLLSLAFALLLGLLVIKIPL